MAVKDWFLANTLVDGWQQLTETAQTAATITGGWIVGSTAPGTLLYSEFESGVERVETTFVATVFPDGVLNTTLKDAFRTPILSGTFAAGDFVFHGVVRAITNGGAQDGRVRVRVIRANLDGTSATELTSAVQIGTTVVDVSTAADFDSSVTITLGAIAMSNQYLFFQLAWERTGAGGMATADIAFRTGSSTTAGARILTPDFVASFTIPIFNGSMEHAVHRASRY